MAKNIFQAARESIEQAELAALPEMQIEDQGQDIDGLFAQEDAMEMAAETLIDRCLSLENLVNLIKDVPQEKATPELAAVVQASILLPGEPSIATEAYEFKNEDIEDAPIKEKTASEESAKRDNSKATDVKNKSEKWDDLKGRAAHAAKVVAEAVKRILQSIVEFMQNIYQWIVGTRKNTMKALAAQKDQLASAPQSVNVEYKRQYKALTHGAGFSPATAESSMSRYAQVLATSANALQDVISVDLLNLSKMSYLPQALDNFQERFKQKTASVFDWNATGAKQTAVVFDGEGGKKVSIAIAGSFFEMTEEETSKTTSVSEASFTRNEMQKLNKMAVGLMKGVEATEPAIVKVQSSIRKLAAINLTHVVLTEGHNLSVRGVRKNPQQIFMQLRRYIAFANKAGIVPAVNAARGIAALGSVYIKGEASTQEKVKDEPHGEILDKQLGYAAA